MACIGCLEVIDTKPRQFTPTDINFLMITARWCIAEYERNELTTKQEINSESNKNDQDINQNRLTVDFNDTTSSLPLSKIKKINIIILSNISDN